MGKTETPIFLETFPEIKIELTKFARTNINRLNCETVTEHLRDKVIPKIYEKNLQKCEDNNKPTYQEFLASFNLKSISYITVWRWMKFIGFQYCDRKKNYFSDRHEDKDNVSYRGDFIKKYFQYEKYAYRWIHIKAEDAKN